VRYTLPHGDLISIHRLKRYEVEMHTLWLRVTLTLFPGVQTFALHILSSNP
jgi:hypothetical protein